jgi:hypothetical protein
MEIVTNIAGEEETLKRQAELRIERLERSIRLHSVTFLKAGIFMDLVSLKSSKGLLAAIGIVLRTQGSEQETESFSSC